MLGIGPSHNTHITSGRSSIDGGCNFVYLKYFINSEHVFLCYQFIGVLNTYHRPHAYSKMTKYDDVCDDVVCGVSTNSLCPEHISGVEL